MEDILFKLYNDPKTGFIGADKLYRKAKAIDNSITLKQVSKWYKTQKNIQQYSKQTTKFPEFKITSINPHEWQIDLAFWEKQPILIGVNINSRIGYAELLKDKRADTVKTAIDEFITKHKVSAVMSDNGSEFTNNKVEKFFETNSISHANSIAGDHTVLGKIDRFIRTIKARLTMMKDTLKFKKLTEKILNDVIDNYNSSHHSAINGTPNQNKDKVMINEVAYNKRVVEQVNKGIPLGSIVRYRLKSTNPFEKEGATWSMITYEVMGLDGLKMRIRSKNNHILYKPVNDLKIVKAEVSDAEHKTNQIYEVEKILDHKTAKTGKRKYLIQWKGYSEPSWELQDNLRLVNKNQMSELEKEYFRKNR
jgi:transposase InsO family protein